MVKISVIVPVYNVEKYLKKCLDSLVNQTMKDIEIIVVNDGTKDNSQKIIDEYKKKYKQIKSYIKENGGMGDARNYGLKYAKGEYIGFVDSDDYISLDMYEKMYKKAIEGDFDVVTCDSNIVSDNEIIKCSSKIEQDTTDIKKCMITFYPVVWNKIYKKKLFTSKLKFKKGVWFEDVEFLYRLFPYIKNIGVVKEELYQYVQRKGSVTHTIDKRLYNYIDNWNGIIKFYKENNLYETYKKELEYCYIRYIYATFVKRVATFDNKEEYNKAVSIAIKNVKQNFPKYYKNKYFYTSLKGIYLILFNKTLANFYYKFKRRSN